MRHSRVLVIGYCQCVKKFTTYLILHQSLQKRSHFLGKTFDLMIKVLWANKNSFIYHIWANFVYFWPILESHWNKEATCPLNYYYFIVPCVLYTYIVWNIHYVYRKNQKLFSFSHWKYTFPTTEAKRP